MRPAAAATGVHPDDATLGPTDFQKVTDGRYRLRFDHSGIEFEVDRMRRKGDELYGELTVRTDLAGALTVERVLNTSDFNFSSLWARERHSVFLRKRARTRDLDWFGALEQFCALVLAAERDGQPAVLLHTAAKPDAGGDDFHVNGFSLPRRHASILFGDGGGMKSYVALAIAGGLALQGVSVGLFDWELDAPDHRERLERLFGPFMPDVWYVRCERPLIHDVQRLRRLASERALQFILFDSVGFACHLPPEKAEAALSYFQAVRQFGPIGTLHIAHISRAEGGDDRPFGSTYWHASARATWFVKASEDSSADVVSLGIFERKRNLGARRPPFGLEARFTDSRTSIERVDLASVPDLASRLSIRQRVFAALRSGARSRVDLAEELGEKPETLRRILNRSIQKGELVQFPGPGGEERIGLPARHQS
jgi:hypothetical protein